MAVIVGVVGSLIVSMPKLSIMVQIGMLVSTRAVFVVFGGSATLFFWVKWMGKLLEVTKGHPNTERGITARMWVSMGALVALFFARIPWLAAAATLGVGNILVVFFLR